MIHTYEKEKNNAAVDHSHVDCVDLWVVASDHHDIPNVHRAVV